MKDDTLLDKAERNPYEAKMLVQVATDDEGFLNNIAFHLQQTAELALKHVLEENGVYYPKTHEIERLIDLMYENGLGDLVPEYLEDKAEMLTLWEAKSRYIKNFHASRRKVMKALDEITKYINRLKEEERELPPRRHSIENRVRNGHER